MHWPRPIRWLLMLAMSGLVVWGAWSARSLTYSTLAARLNHRYQQRIASLTEGQAVRLIRQLGHNDGPWLDVLVRASADDRPAVAAAAEQVLRERIDQWAGMAPKESSFNVAALARLLAREAPMLPPDRRNLGHSVAQRLLEWPIDGRVVDAAKVIADCQAVLVLPRAEPGVALADHAPTAPPVPADRMASAPTPLDPPMRPEMSSQPTESSLPPPPHAGEAIQGEPQPFRPAGAVRITDD